MKFEYSDFYKFIASVGIALISLAVIIPWLFFRESFDLLVDTEAIAKLTPLAQSIIENRQTFLQTTINLVPVFSFSAFILGLLTLVVGGVNWFNRTQKILDKVNELNLGILEQQLARQSPEEARAEKEEEVKAQIEEHIEAPAEKAALEPDIVGGLIQSAYRVQKQLADSLKRCFETSHEVLTERRLRAASFDIVLLAKKEPAKDYIFELKYIRKGFKYNWLRDNVEKVVYASQLYESEMKRESIPVLFVVGPEDMSPETKAGYRQRIQAEITARNAQVLVVLVTEAELSSLDCNELKKMLAV